MVNEDNTVGRMIISSRRGCVVAAAGCGKTEQIARATAISDCKRLILTHTHAGVDAILHRLQKQRVPASKYQISTIAAWCSQFCRSYPKRAGFDNSIPPNQTSWHEVYEACSRLLQSGTVDGIIRASYGGILVDEYQDCSSRQHEVIRLLAEDLPCVVFGDSLQGIFDFGDDPIVDWETDVYPIFPQKAELTEPYRWINARNPELAEWLKFLRAELEQLKQVDLSTCPLCVRYVPLPQAPEKRSKVIQRTCLESLKFPKDQNIIVLDNAAVPESRARLARNLARGWFHNIEALDCKPLAEAAERIDANTGRDRLKALLDFTGECMTGTDKAALERAVQSHMNGRKQGQKAFQIEIPLARRVIETGTSESMLTFLDAINARTNTILYRREMFSAMEEALRINVSNPSQTLSEGVWVVQNRIRHIGRGFGRSSVGSVLLVKGLEFDHAIIVHQSTMTNKDWYVALTRATKDIRILAPSETIVPFVRKCVNSEPSQQSFNFDQ
jgi:DNA helicase-2/ATP-dependent DNA helicase PcrA